jgi:acyl dehydratase
MSLITDYGRAFASTLPVAGRLPFLPGGGGDLPPLTRERTGVAIDLDHLAAYAKVCGFALRDRLPATYLNVLAFPVHIALMTDGAMPFGPVGLVHIANRIVQHRPVSPAETLDLAVSVTGLDPHPKGRTLTLHTTWTSGDEVVWTGESTMLRRGRGDEDAVVDALTVDDDIPASATWRLPGDLGRRYAGVSGDRNPIHLHPLSARLFGVPRAIAHGMWTKARCLAALEPRLEDSFTAHVAFRRPLLLPATVGFGSTQAGATTRFAVRGARDGERHLDGQITSPIATKGSA